MVSGVAPQHWPRVAMAETVRRLTAPGAPFEMETQEVRGRAVRVYVNAKPDLVQLFGESRAFGEKEFLVYGDERITFEAHWRAAAQLANILRRQFNVKHGDRVVLAMRNLPEWSVICWAVIAAGAVIVPLNAWGLGPDLVHGISNSGAKIAFLDRERLQRLRPLLADLPALELIVTRMRGNGGTLCLESLIGSPMDYAALPSEQAPLSIVAPDDDVAIFYTSGTTGRPKGATASHRNITTNLVNTAFRGARAAVRRGDASPPLVSHGPQRCSILPVPLFHVTGFHSTLVPAMANGTKLVLMYKWDVTTALELIQRERANAISGVPAQIWGLVDHPGLNAYDLSSIDTVGYGGAAAAATLFHHVKAVFPSAAPGQGYGATETSSLVSANSAEDFALRPGSVGVACPCCEIRLVGEDGRDASPGEPGELLARGPNVVRGYWGDEAGSADAFVDGWYRTGDVASIDEEGFISILDRVKDMLIRGGENIYCVEIENVLAEHPAIAEVAVVGAPHRMLGEVVGAVVSLRPGMQTDAASIIAFAAARLAPYKVPVDVRFVPDGLPRNAVGKVLKAELRRSHFPTAIDGARPPALLSDQR